MAISGTLRADFYVFDVHARRAAAALQALDGQSKRTVRTLQTHFAKVTFTWKGLAEEYRELLSLADNLTTDAQSLAYEKAVGAAALIQSRYPMGKTGRLRALIRAINAPGGTHIARAKVVSAARHAMVWDHGSHGNRYTRLGYNRGVMPATRTFIPVMVVTRARFYKELKPLMKKWGVQVQGNVA